MTEASDAGSALFAPRELYAPGHFGNSYGALGENEMRDLLEEVAFWGFDRCSEWSDMDDCKDPFHGEHTYGLGNAM